jgi:phosphoglucomutase
VVHDFKKQQTQNIAKGTLEAIKLPKSDVLQFITEDSTRISIRPSGTEPKIKFYFGVKGQIKSPAEYEIVLKKLDAKIEGIIKEMNL